MTSFETLIKRGFDIIGSSIGLLMTGWIILIAYVLASVDTQRNGFFTQMRVGRYGKIFKIIKIRTMRSDLAVYTNITTSQDSRITRLGSFFRKTKIDELPQLINVFMGYMSFVGPRPDVPGYADKLTEEDRKILKVRPGITGAATLKYKDEEEILTGQENPERYNDEVIFPDKVRINLEYVENWSFWKDIGYIISTVLNK